MAEVSRIKIETTTYDLKDETARNINNYSTNEQLIGKWINDENLYRKVVQITIDSPMGVAGQANDYLYPHGISNFNKLVRISGNIDGAYNLIQCGGANVSYGTFFNSINSTNIQMRVINDSWPIGSVLTFIIEYIKN